MALVTTILHIHVLNFICVFLLFAFYLINFICLFIYLFLGRSSRGIRDHHGKKAQLQAQDTKSSHSQLQAQSRDNQLEEGQGYEIPKPAQGHILPPARPYSYTFPNNTIDWTPAFKYVSL